MGQFKQQIYLFTSWRLQVQGQGVCRTSSSRGLSTGHADVVFSLDPHVVIPLCVTSFDYAKYKNEIREIVLGK